MNKKYIALAITATMAVVSLVSCHKDSEEPTQQTVNWVDLGLPSGLLWADRNVGADAPEGYGDYYAWGMTCTTYTYNYSTYPYGTATNQLTKYCTRADRGLDGFTDTLTTLVPGDDAATAKIGNGARTPTAEEWHELIDNTTGIWTTQNGINGRLITGQNGNTLFIPAAGFRAGPELYSTGKGCNYWSSTLQTSEPEFAICVGFISHYPWRSMGNGDRTSGFSIRAVRNAQ
jgi:hypothetical protein